MIIDPLTLILQKYENEALYNIHGGKWATDMSKGAHERHHTRERVENQRNDFQQGIICLKTLNCSKLNICF